MFFETIAYIVDTYMWFLIAALIVGMVTGWVAATDADKNAGEQEGSQ